MGQWVSTHRATSSAGWLNHRDTARDFVGRWLNQRDTPLGLVGLAQEPFPEQGARRPCRRVRNHQIARPFGGFDKFSQRCDGLRVAVRRGCLGLGGDAPRDHRWVSHAGRVSGLHRSKPRELHRLLGQVSAPVTRVSTHRATSSAGWLNQRLAGWFNQRSTGAQETLISLISPM
ncbi:hypothetical protein BW730_15090 [Tessaracoccus aquimaris]|uniref:Uncharacterized protein n=1 Tax=Tessaracoccus aquimaris TaxID=1332264 RepID=A0A1Q2CR99_9ACTN|nr:hypothetical protein BW730_15090 [Tessaracoccus aquimaris]